MTTATVGAPLTRCKDWKSIQWKIVINHVERLQLRIAKAIKLGRHNKAKALQRLLTCSFYAIWRSKGLHRIKGKNTLGVDRKI